MRLTLALLSLLLLVLLSSCFPIPEPDRRLYVAFNAGPGQRPFALLNNTTLTPLPVFPNRIATDIRALQMTTLQGAAVAPRLYATLEGTPGNFVAVQTGTNAILANLTVGNGPAALDLNQAATRAYVANAASNTITVINLLNFTIVTTVALPAGSRPSRLDVDPNGDIWVLNRDAANVTVIDGTAHTIESVIPVPAGPFDLAVNGEGTQAWVTHPAAGSVTLIDTLSRTASPGATGLVNPQAILSYAWFNRILVGTHAGSTTMLHPMTLQPDAPSTAPSNPSGSLHLALNPNSTDFAMVGNGNTIFRSGLPLFTVPDTRTAATSYVRQVETNTPVQLVDSTPRGLRVRLDSTEYTTPVTMNWPLGSPHVLSTFPTQSPGPGVRHLWQSWSHSPSLTSTVAAPAGYSLYNAHFDTQYQVALGPNVTANPSSPDGWYSSGTTVTFSATPPSSGVVFTGWQGLFTTSENPKARVIISPGSVSAIFDPAPQLDYRISARAVLAENGYQHTGVLANSRLDPFTDLRVTALQFTPELGTGSIVNTTSLPRLLGNLGPSPANAPFVITATIPPSLTRWRITLSGTVRNAAGRVVPWSTNTVVVR